MRKKEVSLELNRLGIQTQIGFHDSDTFNHASTLIPSPGIPLDNPYIKTAVDRGVSVTGELDIFSQYNNLPVIAITGTNGKTTTTTLIGDMLRTCGRAPFVGGNIGTPLVDLLMENQTNNELDSQADNQVTRQKADVIVAEVSSFQLDLARQFKPTVGVLLNISEDHLDRYENFAAYENSKWSLFQHQGVSDTAVINQSIRGLDRAVQRLKSSIITFSSNRTVQAGNKENPGGKKPEALGPGAQKSGATSIGYDARYGATIDQNGINIHIKEENHRIETGRLTELQGAHNRENIAAAVLSCLALGADIKGILQGLETFKGLAHRMQFVRSIRGISFYNDSKATNTDAVNRALESFGNNIILILGGREKNTDFSQLIPSVLAHVKTIVAIGESTGHVKNTFDTICEVTPAKTMKTAVQAAFDAARKNDVVLLSPACASFDMYDNYAHRGNDFITHVKALENR
jgi:UDP-N-acetylmuramoylalanine--D-glutamate ligase